jgi:hypothetical protein
MLAPVSRRPELSEGLATMPKPGVNARAAQPVRRWIVVENRYPLAAAFGDKNSIVADQFREIIFSLKPLKCGYKENNSS